MSNATTLQAIELEGQFAVEDTNGGVWHPSEETAEVIAAAQDPATEAVRICAAEPMRGVWHA